MEIEISADARALLDAMSDEYIANVVLPAAVVKAKAIVPVETHALQESIHQEVDGDGMRLVASTDYAVYVELGTRYMAAQPYLRPALYTTIGSE